jgi:hypothetical protein
MATFDHMARIRALIDSEAHGAYNARDVAAQVVAKLRATDPELLAQWLDAQAVQVMYAAINTRDRSLRAHVRRSTAAAAFERDVAAGPEAMGRWLEVPYSVDQGVRKPLGDMDAHDLSAAARAYGMRAIDNRMVEAFLLALSRRVGNGTVRDHYSDEQLGKMWLSITGGSERP